MKPVLSQAQNISQVTRSINFLLIKGKTSVLNKEQKILMVFIEPTPYILGLIKELSLLCQNNIKVLFLKNNYSQRWDIELETSFKVLPKSLWANLLYLFKLLKSGDYKLIHVAGWSNGLTLALFLLARWLNIPLTVDSDTIINSNTPLWKRALKRITYPIIFKLPAAFFSAGQRQKKYFEHYKVDKHKIVIAQMTVDVAKMQCYAETVSHDKCKALRLSLNFNEGDIVFIYVGRLEPYKGIREVLHAFKKLPFENTKLCIIGDGSLRREFEAAAKHNKNVYYAGVKHAFELYDYYMASDVLILYSPLDQWGLVVNEAMAFGKPVIVSDQVGCADDLVIPDKTGVIVPWGRIDLLTKAMQKMIEQSENRIAMSMNAIQRISTWTLAMEACIIFNMWYQILEGASVS